MVPILGLRRAMGRGKGKGSERHELACEFHANLCALLNSDHDANAPRAQALAQRVRTGEGRTSSRCENAERAAEAR